MGPKTSMLGMLSLDRAPASDHDEYEWPTRKLTESMNVSEYQCRVFGLFSRSGNIYTSNEFTKLIING